MRRGEFKVLAGDFDVQSAETKVGYTFEVDVRGWEWRVGVYRDGSVWRTIDLATGLVISSDRTRRDAVESTSDALTVEAMWELLGKNDGHLYDAKAKVFDDVVARGAMPMREYRVAVAETEKMLAESGAESTMQAFERSREPVQEVAADVSLESIRAAIAGWDNVVATQKNERCQIVVRGDTEPHKGELKAMGLHWAPGLRGWWIKPTAQERRAS